MEPVSIQDGTFIIDTNTLIISKTSAKDGGLYKCRGHSILGDEVTSVYLKVVRNSVVDTQSAKHLEFVTGETYAFNCPIQVRYKNMKYFIILHVKFYLEIMLDKYLPSH